MNEGVRRTAETLALMASHMEECAKRIKDQTALLEDTGNYFHAVTALDCITATFYALQLSDLLRHPIAQLYKDQLHKNQSNGR